MVFFKSHDWFVSVTDVIFLCLPGVVDWPAKCISFVYILSTIVIHITEINILQHVMNHYQRLVYKYL